MDYKEVIKKNRKKTKIVLAIYIAIFTFIGLLVDVILLNQGDLLYSLNLLVHFVVFPKATFIMLAIAVGMILYTISSFARIMLNGEPHTEATSHSTDYTLKQIYNIVEELKLAGGLQYMPKVYVIEAEYMNAFASGWNEKNSLVAITTGLIKKLKRDEIQAVLAHEIAHIQHEDVKLTMVVGVLSNVMLLVVNNLVYFFLGNNRSKGAQQAKMILLVFQFILPMITMALQMYLSRSREYMADAGSVELTRDPVAMANALKKISGDYELNDYKDKDTNPTRKAAYIFVKGDSIFSTHPSMRNRILALGDLG